MRGSQQGSATLLVVMVLLLLAALLGGMAVRGSSSDLRLAATQREMANGLYCAESGLNLGRDCFSRNVEQWNNIFSCAAVTLADCTAYPVPIVTRSGSDYPMKIDLDGDGSIDVEVTLQKPVTVDPFADYDLNTLDLTAVLKAECKSTPYKLSQIITFQGRGSDYGGQSGKNAGHTGNQN